MLPGRLLPFVFKMISNRHRCRGVCPVFHKAFVKQEERPQKSRIKALEKRESHIFIGILLQKLIYVLLFLRGQRLLLRVAAQKSKAANLFLVFPLFKAPFQIGEYRVAHRLFPHEILIGHQNRVGLQKHFLSHASAVGVENFLRIIHPLPGEQNHQENFFLKAVGVQAEGIPRVPETLHLFHRPVVIGQEIRQNGLVVFFLVQAHGAEGQKHIVFPGFES